MNWILNLICIPMWVPSPHALFLTTFDIFIETLEKKKMVLQRIEYIFKKLCCSGESCIFTLMGNVLAASEYQKRGETGPPSFFFFFYSVGSGPTVVVEFYPPNTINLAKDAILF